MIHVVYSDSDSLRRSDTYPPWWDSEGKNVTPSGEPCAAATSLDGASSGTTLASRCSRTWVAEGSHVGDFGRRLGGAPGRHRGAQAAVALL